MRFHAFSYRGPESAQQERRQLLRASRLKVDSSFVVVEREMPAFILDDSAKDFRQDGVCRSFGEQPVAFQCRDLLNCTPRQVSGRQVRSKTAKKCCGDFFKRDSSCKCRRRGNTARFEK